MSNLTIILVTLLFVQCVDSTIIAVLGSSVARGHGCSGNCSGNSATNLNQGKGGCYQTDLKNYQFEHAVHTRKVLNSARNGDNTFRAIERLPGLFVWIDAEAKTLATSTDPIHSKFILVGLSLANQGWNGATYRTGIENIISMCQTANVVPIIGLCYANGYKNAENYALTKQINLEIQQMNVPSANFMGGVDDGEGGWAIGHWNDGGHPNDLGQHEMYYTIVPSLFDALSINIPLPAPRQRSTSMNPSRTTLSMAQKESIYFAPPSTETIHSFTISFEIKSTTSLEKVHGDILHIHSGNVDDDDEDARNLRTLSIDSIDGSLKYNVPTSSSIKSDATNILDVSETWHMISVVHWHARGVTELYLDGTLATTNSVNEKLFPSNFTLIVPDNIEFRDLLIYRAGLNEGEINFLWTSDAVLHGSLEIYAPLNVGGEITLNVAQSLSKVSASKEKEKKGNNGSGDNGSDGNGSGSDSGNGSNGNGGGNSNTGTGTDNTGTTGDTDDNTPSGSKNNKKEPGNDVSGKQSASKNDSKKNDVVLIVILGVVVSGVLGMFILLGYLVYNNNKYDAITTQSAAAIGQIEMKNTNWNNNPINGKGKEGALPPHPKNKNVPQNN